MSLRGPWGWGNKGAGNPPQVHVTWPLSGVQGAAPVTVSMEQSVLHQGDCLHGAECLTPG